MGRSRRKAFWFRLPVLCALALAAAAALLAYRAETQLSRLVLGGLGESFSTKVFASPAAVGEGAPREVAGDVRFAFFEEGEPNQTGGGRARQAAIAAGYGTGMGQGTGGQACGQAGGADPGG